MQSICPVSSLQKTLFGKFLILGKFNFFTKAGTADSSLFEIENYDDKLQVDCITLDSLNIKDIKLLKIEAEGAEPEEETAPRLRDVATALQPAQADASVVEELFDLLGQYDLGSARH